MIDRTDLFEKNKKIAFSAMRKTLKKYPVLTTFNAGAEMEDLEQVALMGLWSAINKYDESLGFTFSTYAYQVVEGELLKESRERYGPLRIPRKCKVIARDIAALKEKDANATMTVEEIMDKYECKKDMAEAALNYGSLGFVPLDKPNRNDDNEETTFLDTFYSDINIEKDVLNKLDFEERFSRLDEREGAVVKLTIKEVTQREIAQKLGISQVHVSRLLKRAINKLKDQEVTA
jgi:RNA polymerase sigma-B factor